MRAVFTSRLFWIGIATLARFHVLDLARELTAAGHEVTFYSYLPDRLAMRFGLPKKNLRSFLGWVFPLVFLHRWGPRAWRNSWRPARCSPPITRFRSPTITAPATRCRSR